MNKFQSHAASIFRVEVRRMNMCSIYRGRWSLGLVKEEWS
jgi:hypothetical protein